MDSTIKVYDKYLKDKNVIVVGPGGYLHKKGMGHLIDKFDVVVRLNKGRPIPEDYGSRTDLLYCFCTEMDAEYYHDTPKFKADGIKAISITHGIDQWVQLFKKKLKKEGIVATGPDEKFYSKIWDLCGTKPNTGTVAIADLLRYPLKSLHTLGIDLFASGYCDGYTSYGAGQHDYNKQLYFLSYLANTKNKFTPGRMLYQRINEICRINDSSVGNFKDVSILIPYKPDGGRRDQLFEFSLARYSKVFPDVEICVGIDGSIEDQSFNRGKAINKAAKQATRNIFCITDIDALFDRELLKQAIHKFSGRTILTGRSWQLSDRCTQKLLKQEFPICNFPVHIIGLDNIKFFTVVGRHEFESVMGFDEQFETWGGEDFAFFKSLDIFCDPPKKIPAHIYHLWHPPSRHKPLHMQALRKGIKNQVSTVDRHNAYDKARTKKDIYWLRREGSIRCIQ